MVVVLGCAVLILTIGMVVLFAMFGELSSRVAAGGAAARSTEIRALEKAELGRIPDSWPAGLPARQDRISVLLVLSSVCGSCAEIAGQLTKGHTDWQDMGIVLSTSHGDTGQDFIMRHGLSRFPHYIDVGGDWVSGQFGVRFSPSALILSGGRLQAAYMFQDVSAWRTRVSQLRAYGPREQDREAV